MHTVHLAIYRCSISHSFHFGILFARCLHLFVIAVDGVDEMLSCSLSSNSMRFGFGPVQFLDLVCSLVFLLRLTFAWSGWFFAHLYFLFIFWLTRVHFPLVLFIGVRFCSQWCFPLFLSFFIWVFFSFRLLSVLHLFVDVYDFLSHRLS